MYGGRMRVVALVCGSILAVASCAKPPVAPSRAPVEQRAGSSATRVFHVDGFAQPESVLYDAFHDRYLVSNINGPNTRFITVVEQD